MDGNIILAELCSVILEKYNLVVSYLALLK